MYLDVFYKSHWLGTVEVRDRMLPLLFHFMMMGDDE